MCHCLRGHRWQKPRSSLNRGLFPTSSHNHSICGPIKAKKHGICTWASNSSNEKGECFVNKKRKNRTGTRASATDWEKQQRCHMDGGDKTVCGKKNKRMLRLASTGAVSTWSLSAAAPITKIGYANFPTPA